MSGIVGSRLNIRGSGLIGGLGTDGQVLTSGGAGEELIFESVSSAAITAINNPTANELVTVGSTTTELDAEANLTFDGTNVLIGGTGKIYFNDAGGEHISGSGSVLSIAGGSEIDLTATAVDLNGTLNVSGVATFQATPVFPDGSLALADLDIDGGTDIGAAVVDADLFIVDDGAGGTNRKVTASRIKTYAGGASVMSDLTDVSMDATNFVDSLLIQTNSDGSAPGTGTLSGANDNTGIGKNVFAAITSGNNNVAIGNNAMDACTTGNTNVSIGANAHGALTTAYNSTAVGHNALAALETGYYNTAVGYNALAACTANYNTAVGHASLTTVTTGTHNTGVGWATLNVTTGGYNVALGSQCMQANTSGQYNIAAGHLALDANTTASNNIAIGTNAAGANTEGARIIAIGHHAYDAADTEVDNIAIGIDALGGAVAGGEYNTAIGNYSLDALTSADSNVAIGYGAGTAITTGGTNSIVGRGAGAAITTGLSNVLMGAYAGGAVTSADQNVCIGSSAGGAVTGERNTFIGQGAGDAMVSGSDNTCIGVNCDASANDVSNAISLGAAVNAAANDFSFGKASNVVTNDFDADADWSRSSDIRLKRNIQDTTLGLDFINDLRPVKFQWKPSNEVPKEMKAEYNEVNQKNLDIVSHGFIAQEVKEAIDKYGDTTFGGWHLDKTDNETQRVKKNMFVMPLIKAVQELTARVKELEAK